MFYKLWINLTLSTRYIFAIFALMIVGNFFLFNPVNAHTYQSSYSNPGQGVLPFKQEIARLLITVERAGREELSISKVPRVQKDDLLRIRLVDEPINGIKPDQSLWDWTLVAAFVNPSRKEVSEDSVSREINFRTEGWYREYQLKVPYDSQPVFFLYPKNNYRTKIKKLIGRNFKDIKKIGEQTLEIAGAYAQIGIFLSELQSIIRQDPYGSGSYYSTYGYGTGSLYGPDFIRNQLVERLAQSFNIALPGCWNGNSANSYSSGYGSINYAPNDFVSRAQCVAKNVRLEDFDLSVGRIFQQGGLLAAAKLVEKYPQLAYWINAAAAAADLILKIMRKTPLKIVPTMVQTPNAPSNTYGQYTPYNNGSVQPGFDTPEKISVFAESPPTDGGYVTAFPIILHKWQSEPDPGVIKLPAPRLLDSCLHAGQNVLKNTDLLFDWLRDPFTRDFKLIMSADNGFTKEFQLIKNIGMSGWMLNLTPPDIQAFPKVRMDLEAKIIAIRGFNQIESDSFYVPISGGGKWEISPEAAQDFAVGGKRRVIVRNTMGSCRCLRSVVYKPSFGGEFTFGAGSTVNPLRFTENGKDAWFEIDTTNFLPGQGTLELRTFGTQQQP
ncbi:MAG: hypothetical protein KDB79_14835, partial [Acidobacteria bacterium]|nr:hypothetical protein [Acidobacteriota bacterium]